MRIDPRRVLRPGVSHDELFWHFTNHSITINQIEFLSCILLLHMEIY